MKHAIFMMVKTTNAWLAMPPKERFAFLDEYVRPLLKKHPQVQMRYFDAEGFSARVTDVILWETEALNEYQAIVEQLRETKFWGPYFEIQEIIPTLEDAYADHYQVPRISNGTNDLVRS